MNKRVTRERNFHDHIFKSDNSDRKAAEKYYAVNKMVRKRYFTILSNECRDKKILELGCGKGGGIKRWVEAGALFTGIDISAEGIKQAKMNLLNHKLMHPLYDKVEYFVMNAEKTSFDEKSFDIVFGKGIVHHLDIKKLYPELCRVLGPNGQAIFAEPLGHNPIFNLYRAITPKMRSKDEQPLKQKDIELLNKYFQLVDVYYYSLFTLFTTPFSKTPIFEKLYNVLEIIDKAAFSLPLLRKCAWTVVIHARYPRK